MVDYEEATIAAVYDRATHDRAQLAVSMYVLLGVLVLLSLGIGLRFATLVERSHRKEQSARETAERALTSRDELMGVVVHDLRNPLGSITMRAALLREGADAEAVRKQAESIENVAMRMEYLIKSLLEVATSPESETPPEECSVHPS